MPVMRAKMKVANTKIHEDGGPDGCYEDVYFGAVSKPEGYPEDGSDENNTYAKWTPTAELSMCITNPALIGKFAIGQEFYLDFTEAK